MDNLSLEKARLINLNFEKLNYYYFQSYILDGYAVLQAGALQYRWVICRSALLFLVRNVQFKNSSVSKKNVS